LKIVVTGLNHKTAPVEVRERLALSGEHLRMALMGLGTIVSENAIVSTCHRTEVYAIVGEQNGAAANLGRFIASHGGLSKEATESYLYTYWQEDAVKHLFRVACGMDSMVIGEYEVLGQVRDAFSAAASAGTLSVPLTHLFHSALRAGRRARSETRISWGAASVSSAAVQMAEQVCGDISQCSALVISAGEAGRLVAKTLKDSGAREIAIANRTKEKAEELAKELGGSVVDLYAFGEQLSRFDIVISATGAPHIILFAETVKRAMQQRGGKPMCLIDIAVPRDIDEGVKKVENVRLYDVDDLEAVCATSQEERGKEVSKVEKIVDEDVEAFMHWWDAQKAVPLVAAIKEKAEIIRSREMAKSLRKMGHLTEEDRQRLEALTKSIVSKILHDPIISLKEQGQSDGYIKAALELFRLDYQGENVENQNGHRREQGECPRVEADAQGDGAYSQPTARR